MAIARLPLRTRPAQSGDRARRWLRLVWIELRFSYAGLVMPLAVAAAICFFNAWMWEPDRRWDVVSSNLGQSILLIGPAGALWAAFVAAREERSRLSDLTASLPTGSLPRHLLVIGTPVVGSVGAYAAGAAVVVGWYGRSITWGGPDWGQIGFGAAVVLACAALGAAFGRLVRGRFAPVIAGGSMFLYLVISWSMTDPYTTARGWALLAYPRDRLALASPLFRAPADLHADEQPLLAGYVIAFTLVAAAIAVLVAGNGRPKGAVPLAIVAAIGFAVAGQMTVITPADRARADRAATEPPIPVANPPLVCSDGTVTICLHAIDARDLDQASAAVDALLGPLQGLPGVPHAIEMRADLPSEPGVLRTNIAGWEVDAMQLTHVVIPAVFDPDHDGQPMTAAEQVVAVWLIAPVVPLDDLWFIAPPEPAGQPADVAAREVWRNEVGAAAGRFAALSPEQQRAWLAANWDALRAGTLTLEDLP